MASSIPILSEAEIVEPEIRTRTQTSSADSARDWLCAWCLNRVATEKDRFAYEGKSEFSFRNPAGVRFQILLFAPTLRCRSLGEPTLEFTWFPGHAWSYCLCDRCRTHLGWFYTGPSHFAGLICERIVKAHVMLS